MSTEQDRKRNLEAEVPEGVSPTATRTGSETDSAASYGPAPLSESDANRVGASSGAGGSEGKVPGAGANEGNVSDAATSEGKVSGATAGEREVPGAAPDAVEVPGVAAGEQEIGSQPLFGDADVDRLRTAWRQLQGSFVDNPHEAVTQADDLVMATVQQLSTTLAERKQSLEHLWSREEEGDTEDLRLALRSYRAFFEQLVGTSK